MHEEAITVLPLLLAALDLHRPVLVGHSDGASIALLHAGMGQTVAGLVLLAPHVFVEDRTIAGIKAAKLAYEQRDLRERLARHHADVDQTFWGWNNVWLSPSFRAWDIQDHLSRIKVPVLLVQGVEDEYGTTAQLDAIEARIAGPVRRVELGGAGHAPHHDQPEQTLDAVISFIRRLT
jgi:pimeloyl-ACP methyl ester carboxylesterase